MHNISLLTNLLVKYKTLFNGEKWWIDYIIEIDAISPTKNKELKQPPK